MAGSPMRVKNALMDVKVTAPARLLHTAAAAISEKYQRGSPFSLASAGQRRTTTVPHSDIRSRPTRARVHCFSGRCWSVMRPTMNAKAISKGNRATAILAKASLLTPLAWGARVIAMNKADVVKERGRGGDGCTHLQHNRGERVARAHSNLQNTSERMRSATRRYCVNR